MVKENIKIILKFFFLFAFLAFVEIRAIDLSIEKKELKNQLIEEKINDNNIITLSFVGDCTLGTGANYSYANSFIEKYNLVKNDQYFFGGVYDILGNDTLTIANLEGVLSDNANTINPKEYNYKGPSRYANILKIGSVEMVNLANNHTYDYLQKGYSDTIKTLNNYGVLFFGYENYQIIEIRGIRIGIVGLGGWDYGTAKNDIDKANKYFEDMNVNLTIFNFHWGQMRVYDHNKTQENIAHYAINKGADLVIGHHPHVLQGIEKYHDKYIAYSLGNFVYGGIYYPYDSDSVILQMQYEVDNKKIIKESLKLIPVSITSSGKKNDYRPKVLEGKEKQRVLNKILKYSTNFNYS